MRLGVAETFLEKTIRNLQTCFFSVNMDEATSNNRYRVLAILVSYFNPDQDRVVVEHLVSLSLTRVDSESVFNAIDKQFKNFKIPYENLMSILLDSCSVMRGSKSGVETRIREKAPHLVDIDGDVCHHVHNGAQKFCHPFEHWLEAMFNTIHMDFYWSAELRDSLMRMCELLSVKYTTPQKFINHRWLSAYDNSINTIRMFDVYMLFYYSFVEPQDKCLYKDIIEEIYCRRNVSVPCRRAIKGLQSDLFERKKAMTDKGKKRKNQVIIKILLHRDKTQFTLEVYSSALSFLKEYVCLFQSSATMVHKLHVKQIELFRDFLACFVKVEAFKDLKAEELKDPNILDLSDKKILMPRAEMYTNDSVTSDTGLLRKVKEAYVECGQYLQKKLPLDNKLLVSMVALDPRERGKTGTQKLLKELPDLAKNVLSDSELKAYKREVMSYNNAYKVPEHVKDGKDIELDIWWAAVGKEKKFPYLTKMAKALMSCFHGPSVESSFNVMGDIIDPKSAAMHVPTFSAIQTVKYGLRARNLTSLDMFDMNPDKKNADRSFAKNIMSARTRLERERDERKKIANENKAKLELSNVNLQSAAKAKKLLAKAAKDAFGKHKTKQLNGYKKVLEDLVKRRKAEEELKKRNFLSQFRPLHKSSEKSSKKRKRIHEKTVAKKRAKGD